MARVGKSTSMTPLFFSAFEVTTQAFYRSSLSYAIVNLKPIVPGHVLVVPKRPVPRLDDLNDDELVSLIRSVRRVGATIQKAYGGDGLTIACQDGAAAGQTVPHVHFHILPRKLQGDYFSGRNDEIYPELERNEHSLPSSLLQPPLSSELKVDADEDRAPRTLKEMEEEASRLKLFMDDEI